MKRAPKSAKVLLRCLNARQFGLKLIANVTYGYTAAGFSGAGVEVTYKARRPLRFLCAASKRRGTASRV